jgi:hypothetical protein
LAGKVHVQHPCTSAHGRSDTFCCLISFVGSAFAGGGCVFQVWSRNLVCPGPQVPSHRLGEGPIRAHLKCSTRQLRVWRNYVTPRANSSCAFVLACLVFASTLSFANLSSGLCCVLLCVVCVVCVLCVLCVVFVCVAVRPFAQGCPCGRARACGEPLYPVHRRIVVLLDNCSTSHSHRYRCRRACTCCRTGAECPLLHKC